MIAKSNHILVLVRVLHVFHGLLFYNCSDDSASASSSKRKIKVPKLDEDSD